MSALHMSAGVCDVRQQRLAASRTAADVRRARAALLARMRRAGRREGRAMCADIIEDTPDVLSRMPVHQLLEQCPGIGPEVADAIQEAVGLHRVVAVGDLLRTERAALVAVLRLQLPAGHALGFTREEVDSGE